MEKIPAILQNYIQENSLLAAAPGRINLIGEHTDYNNGFVLPAAIDKYIYFVLTPRKDAEIHLQSLDLQDSYQTDTNALAKCERDNWPNYLLGVVKEFKDRNIALKGFDLTFTGEVPAGSGMSSSAAVECGMAVILNQYLNANIDKVELVKMAQHAENDFVGMNCGIMDQFASMFGKKNQLIELDCRDLHYEYVPFQLDDYVILLLDTNVKHSLASSEYNTRRQECEAGVAAIQQKYPNVKSLRDVDLSMLDACVSDKDSKIYHRCKYVIGEIARLQAACDDLRQNDLHTFGQKMIETHWGLSKDYEVSCPELDFFVDFVKDNKSVLGSRVMGGGFGGCTINIIEKDAVEPLLQSLAPVYKAKFGLELKHYIAHISEGAHLIAR